MVKQKESVNQVSTMTQCDGSITTGAGPCSMASPPDPRHARTTTTTFTHLRLHYTFLHLVCKAHTPRTIPNSLITDRPAAPPSQNNPVRLRAGKTLGNRRYKVLPHRIGNYDQTLVPRLVRLAG